ncbi:MAG: GNAT family N-acetyltransferase [Acidimicrobiales bacterium]
MLRLRFEVFVLEQQSFYLDTDGRDLEPETRHLWIEDQNQIVAYLRVLADGPDGHCIGRVVTAPQARGRGLGALLVNHVASTTSGPLTLNAQAYLADWYLSLGYEATGEVFDEEDGIPHLPMALKRL